MKTSEELTEDWNAGKLEQGWYYVKFADEIYPDYFNGYFIQTGDKCGIEVLAPVPDYEEFKSLRKTANGVKYVSDKCWEKTKALEGNVTMFKSLFRQYLEREKDIENLRALLKECKKQIRKLLIKYIDLDKSCDFEQGYRWDKKEFKKK